MYPSKNVAFRRPDGDLEGEERDSCPHKVVNYLQLFCRSGREDYVPLRPAVGYCGLKLKAPPGFGTTGAIKFTVLSS